MVCKKRKEAEWVMAEWCERETGCPYFVMNRQSRHCHPPPPGVTEFPENCRLEEEECPYFLKESKVLPGMELPKNW